MKVEYGNLEVYELLLQVCSKYDADPGSSIASEEYYKNLLQEYDGDYNMEQLRVWLNERISKLYIALEKRPRWIQNEAWPFHGGKPMIFVGQIDISVGHNEAAKHFHDDTTFYVFYVLNTSIYEVIVQQY